MGAVETVIAALQKAGIRAAAAYPGERLPYLTEPVAAVCLAAMDYAEKTATVRISAISPAASGGAASENAAVAAAEAVKALGNAEIPTGCSFDAVSDCYSTDVLLQLSGKQAYAGWAAHAAAFSVSLGGTALPHAVSFRAVQQADPNTGTALSAAAWKIVLTEEFLPGDTETVTTAEQFNLTVTRATAVEIFQNCVWTEIRREDGAEKLRQIRTGTAQKRLRSTVVG